MSDDSRVERAYELANEGKAALAVDVLTGYCASLEDRIAQLEVQISALHKAHDKLESDTSSFTRRY